MTMGPSVRRLARWLTLATWLLTMAIGSAWAADAATTDPQASQAAWRALLGLSENVLPRGSGCEGDYGQTSRARVKDLLASQLAYMGTGHNALTGRCEAGHCEVQLSRRNGEDVSSAALRFRLQRGRAELRSLRCVMTP